MYKKSGLLTKIYSRASSMSKRKYGRIGKNKVFLIANLFYALCLIATVFFIGLGMLASSGFGAKSQSSMHDFGASVYKYPFLNTYLIVSSHRSELSYSGLHEELLLSLNGCKVSDHDSVEKLFACANIDSTERLSISILSSNKTTNFEVARDKSAPFTLDVFYLGLDALLLLASLSLSLLLFAKARRFLSGYLISLVLLLNVGESTYFFMGSIVVDANFIETLRIGLSCVISPFAAYFFPQAFTRHFWKSYQFVILCVSVVLVLVAYNAFPFFYFMAAVSLMLLTLIAHFIIKYRSELNIKERKQVKTMLLSVTVGLILYISLIIFGGVYGFLLGRSITGLCVGLGVFFALMRYGLWQVETLISKSAALSLLSVIAFSLWAGLDQALQVILNQTIGLSNKTFTAFVAAAISSLFVVPVYNFVSKSCDAFFNKDLYQLKRLLSKEILVFAETLTLAVFTQKLSSQILTLTGASKISIEFMDLKRLPEPITYGTNDNTAVDGDSMVKEEVFTFTLEDILYVNIHLTFIDKRINKEIKHELEEGTDEIARALASCCRWNYLESMNDK